MRGQQALIHSPYVGRFAPTPSGPLHFGSLVAALGSALEARRHGGRWLVRIEDVDVPRAMPGMDGAMLATLERFGFEWDGEVLWQSRRADIYASALERLKAGGHVFPCACSRREQAEVPDSILARDGSLRYPGTCRSGLPLGVRPRAWRVRAEGTIRFEDAIQGGQEEELARDVGDYVVFRADGVFAYQLAVVVDDAEQGVTHVVRGADLLGSTARQIHLQKQLGLPVPNYAHLPVATNAAGEKLSKQTQARAVDEESSSRMLVAALDFLGQNPDAELGGASVRDIWAWALGNWKMERVPRVLQLPAAELARR
ncbi:MAG: tRNA glutamyl-Q(34) synthetase GluQRS [Azoarcus sp.]|nr:tRNA glutamyl-Q(34) synthetase GluQRS [Azoarcus sp.]